MRQEPRIDGGIMIPCRSEGFIRAWLEVMRPVHKLTVKEMDVAASIISRRAELSRDIKDINLVDRLLLGNEERKRFSQVLDMSQANFKMFLHNLREKGILVGNRVNPSYIPEWEPGKPFRWVFVFKNDP